MDIPVPDKTVDEQKVAVRTTAASATSETPVSPANVPSPTVSESEPVKTDQQPQKLDMKDEALAQEEQNARALAELIETKKYFLPIKEKKQSAALTFITLPKKSKKVKKASVKKTVAHKSKSQGRQTLLVIVLIVVLLGTIVAADAGMIDIGIKLPFDFIKTV